MLNVLKPYILAFIPIFVAVDAIGNIPVFIGMIEGASKKHKKQVIFESVATATIMAVSFMFIGKIILRFIGITISDFQIAGGLLIFIIAMRLLLPGSLQQITVKDANKDIGVFPMGTPLITGPAVLTTTLIMLDTYGVRPTFVSLMINMLLVWILLSKSDLLIRVLGENGTRAFSKIMYILLAAIGVMMVRKGILGVIHL